MKRPYLFPSEDHDDTTYPGQGAGIEGTPAGTAEHADRPDGRGNPGHHRSPERDPRGRVRALYEDKELPLAPEWSTLSGLSPDVRRTGGSALRDDGPHRRARPQDWRFHDQVDQPHLSASARPGQRR